ncbi:MAG: DNA polymerase III subunit delta' [Alphaproteobacteria bacterium]|nr:DNA polymerase III subunit delta' [Alphaproteobacteria bacterium]
MAKKTVEPKDSDRIEGFAHPRETAALLGQDLALGRAARALRAGRPPSAWLITGAPGVGKATLAYRIARYLLAFGATAEGPEDLRVPQDHPAARQVASQAHPGLLVLKRAINPRTGKLMTVLSVDEIRRLANFFGMTSGAGGWRVAIVDTADDMNDNAANALLKMLEEPPGNAMLLLLSNTPGRLLPTIRSRCQRLDLRPLDEAAMDQGLKQHLPDENAAERAALARLAGGSIGAALTLATGDGGALAKEADKLIDHARDPDLLALLTLGEKLYRTQDGLELFGEFLSASLADRIRARAYAGAPGLERWVAALNRLEQGFARAAGLNLEPRQTVLSAARDLFHVARNGAL